MSLFGSSACLPIAPFGELVSPTSPAQSTAAAAPAFGTCPAMPFRVSVDDEEEEFENESTGCPFSLINSTTIDDGYCHDNVAGMNEIVSDKVGVQELGQYVKEVQQMNRVGPLDDARSVLMSDRSKTPEDMVSETNVTSVVNPTVASVAKPSLPLRHLLNVCTDTSGTMATVRVNLVLNKEVEPGKTEEPFSEAMNSENEPCAKSSANEASCCTLPAISKDVDKYVHQPQNATIIKQILAKHGDITTGSILKSINAKMSFLELLADVVSCLCSHTLVTLSSKELRFAKAVAADAAAVGFDVEWLQQSVNEVSTALKLHAYYEELNNLEEQIEAAKKLLIEMDLRRAVLESAVPKQPGIMQCRLGQGLL